MVFNFFYSIGVKSYAFMILIASLFNKKAKLWLTGRKNILKNLKNENFISPIWFHVSSLGEFEQARPIIEKIKKHFPTQQIILTFFSPSGYEIRKNYNQADFVYYLPIDTKKNAKLFLKIIEPKIVFFVKYDFWKNYIEQIYFNKIPLYLVSGIFREEQIFFKNIGKKYAEILKYFTRHFVQDQKSVDLLKSINIKNVTLAGDTRFDRVIEISEQSEKIEIIENFVGNKFCFIAGSTWLADEKILSEYINNQLKDIKFIIAPHDISENRIIEFLQLLKKNAVRFSKAEINTVNEYSVLIIDNMGMLSSIYKYAKIAYIGGGFGTGIHNVLEAAVYGMPVIFGPNYKKFNEAKDLIDLKAAFSIKNYTDFQNTIDMFMDDEVFLTSTSEKAKYYVGKNKGASQIVLNFVFKNNSIQK